MRRLPLRTTELPRVGSKYIPEEDEDEFEDDPTPKTVARSLEIDRSNLHIEAENLASLFRKYSRILRNKRMKLNDEKMRRKEIESELSFRIRENPKSFDLKVDRVTDKIVELVTNGHPDYISQKRKELRLEVEVKEWEDVLEALRMKSHNVKTEFEMWQLGYYTITLKKKEIWKQT